MYWVSVVVSIIATFIITQLVKTHKLFYDVTTGSVRSSDKILETTEGYFAHDISQTTTPN